MLNTVILDCKWILKKHSKMLFFNDLKMSAEKMKYVFQKMTEFDDAA